MGSIPISPPHCSELVESMIKLAVSVAVLAGASWFAMQKVPSLRQWAVEVINPAVRGGRVLGALKTNLDTLDSVLGDLSQAKNIQEVKTAAEKGRAILKDSSALVQEAAAINDSSGKVLESRLSKVMDVLGVPTISCP